MSAQGIKVRLVSVSTGVVVALLAPAAARAGGLFVPGAGPQAAGRAGAFVARADDGTALSYNPAGLAKQRGTSILLGANLIDYDVSFQRDGVYDGEPDEVEWAGEAYAEVHDESKPAIGIGGFQAIPTFAVSTDLGLGVDGLRFGVGLVVPLGFPERNVDSDYEFEADGVAPPPARYDAVTQEAAVVLPSVAVGYALGKALGIGDKLDIGGRFSWGFGSIKASSYVWGVRNYDESVASDGLFTVDASDGFIPVFAGGLLYRPTDNIEIGAAYTSQINIDAKGTGSAIVGSRLASLGVAIEPPPDEFAQCAPGGIPTDDGGTPDDPTDDTAPVYKGCASIKMPQTASLGARWVLRTGEGAQRIDRADVELDVVWEDWSATSDFDVLVDAESLNRPLQRAIIRHGFQDTISIRAGGSYVLDVGTSALALRAGAAYDTAAAKEGWQRVDLDGAARTTLMAGASWQMSRFQVDIAGGVVLEGANDVEGDCNPTATEIGCAGTNADEPVADREQPDPIQPLAPPAAQVQSPFNSGHYKSHYVSLALGVSTWF